MRSASEDKAKEARGLIAETVAIAALWLTIWAREAYLFRVFSHDYMSEYPTIGLEP